VEKQGCCCNSAGLFFSLYKTVIQQHLNGIMEINFVNTSTTTMHINTAVLGFAKEIPETYEVPSF